MSEDRKRAMKDGFERNYGVSMGCKVEESYCTVCGGVVQGCEHTRTPTAREVESMRQKYLGPHFSISFVKSPRCEACGEAMEPAGDIHWSCVNDDCDRKGISIHTGVYPFIPIKES